MAKASDKSKAPAKKAAAKKAPAKKAAAKKTAAKKPAAKKAVSKQAEEAISGYGSGGVETVISVDEVTRQVAAIAEEVSIDKLDSLVGGDPYVTIENLNAGYGKMEILHDVSLRVGRKQSLCLIGPNGAGKSTVLHAIFGFNNIFSTVSLEITNHSSDSDWCKQRRAESKF